MSAGAPPRSPTTRSACTRAAGWPTTTATSACATASGRYLATPTATSKAAVRADGLVVVDDAGAKVGGRGKPFSEIGLHLTVYANRGDVHAVIHAHPPTATGFAVAGVPLDEAFLAEAVVSLGPGVPTVPFAAPGPDACRALGRVHSRATTRSSSAGTACSAGAPTSRPPTCASSSSSTWRASRWSRGSSAACGRCRRRSCRSSWRRAPRPASARRRRRRRARRQQAHRTVGTGTGRTASRAAAGSAKPVVVACAPPPPGSDVEVYDPKRAARAAVLPSPAELASIIRQEIAAALKK